MKRSSLIVLLGIIVNIGLYAKSNKIEGVWKTQEGKSKVEIYKNNNGKYYGKIIWLREPINDSGKPKIDDKNPEVKYRNRPIMNLNILQGFVYDNDDEEWEGGTIYDPSSGNTYKCYIWFEKDPNILYVKGYIGFSLIGKTVNWTRVKE